VDLYKSQMSAGSKLRQLRPVISTWILDRDLLRGLPHWHNRFHVREARTGHRLTDHLEIHTVELRKLAVQAGEGLDDGTRWACLLREARHWDALPSPVNTSELRKAMAILDQWAEKAADYRAYKSRLMALRVQAEIEDEQRDLEAAKEQPEADKVQLEADNTRLEAELSRLRAQLAHVAPPDDRQR